MGLGPIWQSANATARKKAAALLDSGEIFAFGRRADQPVIDSSEMDIICQPASDPARVVAQVRRISGSYEMAP